MRRVDLDHLQPQLQNLLDVRENVGSMPRVQAPTGKQAVRIFFHVIGNKLVHAAGEPDDLRGHVVDEHGTVNSAAVHVLQKRSRGPAELLNLLEIRPILFHEFQRMRLEHLHRLDVNVAIGDHWRRRSPQCCILPAGNYAAGHGTNPDQSIPCWNFSSGSKVVLKVNAN